MLKKIILFLLLSMNQITYASFSSKSAITEPIPIKEIKNFSTFPEPVKQLIITANHLSLKNLTYLYGSSDPAQGGMDCSGTIYYLLNQNGIKNPPRSADDMFHWLKKNGHFISASNYDLNSAIFSQLNPGDLLFWSGTYRTNKSNSISHVMLYLGKNNQNQHLMFGSSDGRTYQGKKMWGVSVFDFKLPTQTETAKFIGFSCIPNLTCQ